MESSRTHFQVLGLEGQVLGLKSSSPRKLPVLGSTRTALVFEFLKICTVLKIYFFSCFFFGKHLKKFLRIFFWSSPKIFLKNFYFIYLFILFFIFWRTVALESLLLGLGLERFCPWPRKGLSSEELSLALTLDFFCIYGCCSRHMSLVLTSSLMSSTTPLAVTVPLYQQFSKKKKN